MDDKTLETEYKRNFLRFYKIHFIAWIIYLPFSIVNKHNIMSGESFFFIGGITQAILYIYIGFKKNHYYYALFMIVITFFIIIGEIKNILRVISE